MSAPEPPNGAARRPSPYEALSTPSQPGPRGGAGAKGFGGPLGWVLNDAGLKILALVLAAMMWRLVHDMIQREDAADRVVVEIVDLPKEVRLVGGNLRRVAIKLVGPGSDVERVKSEFNKQAGRATLRLDTFTGDHGEFQSIVDAKKLGYTVEGAREVVTTISPPIRVEWYRVEEVVVDVAAPELSPIKGRTDLEPSQGYPTVEVPKVKVVAPVAVARELRRVGSIRPDPIDATAWLASDPDFTVPFDWRAGFDLWRGESETRAPDVLTFDPPQVKGKMRLRVNKSEVLENALQVLYPAGTDEEAYRDWAVELSGTEYDRTSRKIRLGVRGEQKAVQEMKAKPSDWCFAVELPPPPREGETPRTNEKAPVFLWLKQDPSGPVRLDGRPSVFVSLKKRG